MELAERRAQLCEHDHKTSAGQGLCPLTWEGDFEWLLSSTVRPSNWELRVNLWEGERPQSASGKIRPSFSLLCWCHIARRGTYKTHSTDWKCKMHQLHQHLLIKHGFSTQRDKLSVAPLSHLLLSGRPHQGRTSVMTSVHTVHCSNIAWSTFEMLAEVNDSKSFVAASEWRLDSISVNVYGMVCWCMLDVSQWTIMF